MEEWVPMNEFSIDKTSNCIAVDTRDFHAIQHKVDMKKEINHFYYEKFNKLIELIESNNIPNQSIIQEKDIIPFVEKLKNIRDGANIIMLRFKDVEGGFSWIKYLRFYRIGDTDEFIATNDCIPIHWRDIDKSKLISKY